jgi:penicillin-binding protein 2
VLPTPGSDIRTTLDLRMQKLTEKSLAEGIVNARSVDDTGSGPGRGGTYKAPAGAVVVLDPDNGEVIALASYPDFQPERFVGGVDTRYWRWLQHPRNDFPLINRVAQSSYPPGSVFKVVSAAAALSNGYVTPSTTVPCPGYWDWNGQIFRNWNPADSGSMTIDQALQYSCDTVFYAGAVVLAGQGLGVRCADGLGPAQRTRGRRPGPQVEATVLGGQPPQLLHPGQAGTR